MEYIVSDAGWDIEEGNNIIHIAVINNTISYKGTFWQPNTNGLCIGIEGKIIIKNSTCDINKSFISYSICVDIAINHGHALNLPICEYISEEYNYDSLMKSRIVFSCWKYCSYIAIRRLSQNSLSFINDQVISFDEPNEKIISYIDMFSSAVSSSISEIEKVTMRQCLLLSNEIADIRLRLLNNDNNLTKIENLEQRLSNCEKMISTVLL